ncbi:dienelactone hydrolase family protein [Sulfobacillus harzensis]|uniref:Dienelactone hydrolase family protein n=1 Tax=Sulfobacillus harzensis TaxID=2729629 RepID=A0A7Y0Q356_9FIRM|nr:dienelactone hydrolase family protein [Sulfobacillus harzensis]NMP23222.1 dienelactone hydrolase family protein [Sulfobacillus harzensis]
MKLQTNWITDTLDGQSMRAYLARPEAAGDKPLPTVIVIQEIWGVDDHIQDMTDRFATARYQAIAPDLYSLGETPEALTAPRIQAVKKFLDTMPPEGWGNPEVRDQYISQLPAPEAQNVRETLGLLFQGRDMEGYVKQLKRWVDYAESHGKGVVSVGYCMGGALSFLLACRDHRLKAAVCNYGRAPSEEDRARLETPVYGFYGETDHALTDAVPAVRESMQQLGKPYHAKIYNGAGHAFFNDTRASYNVDAARDAWAETLGFFAKNLG